MARFVLFLALLALSPAMARAADLRILNWDRNGVIGVEPASVSSTGPQRQSVRVQSTLADLGGGIEQRDEVFEVDCAEQTVRRREHHITVGARQYGDAEFEPWHSARDYLDHELVRKLCLKAGALGALPLVAGANPNEAAAAVISARSGAAALPAALAAKWGQAFSAFSAKGAFSEGDMLAAWTGADHPFAIRWTSTDTRDVVLWPLAGIDAVADGRFRVHQFEFYDDLRYPGAVGQWSLIEIDCAQQGFRPLAWSGVDQQGRTLYHSPGYMDEPFHPASHDVLEADNLTRLCSGKTDPYEGLPISPRTSLAEAIDGYDRFYSPTVVDLAMSFKASPWRRPYLAACGWTGCRESPSLRLALEVLRELIGYLLAVPLSVLVALALARISPPREGVWRGAALYRARALVFAAVAVLAVAAYGLGWITSLRLTAVVAVISLATAALWGARGYIRRIAIDPALGLSWRDALGRTRSTPLGAIQSVTLDDRNILVRLAGDEWRIPATVEDLQTLAEDLGRWGVQIADLRDQEPEEEGMTPSGGAYAPTSAA